MSCRDHRGLKLAPFRTDAEIAESRREEALTALAAHQLREDVRAVLGSEEARRLVWMFVQLMGVDGSPFSNNGPAQSRNIGRMEAGQWWLQAMRDNCPEREAQMRAEANRHEKRLRAQLQANEETQDDR